MKKLLILLLIFNQLNLFADDLTNSSSIEDNNDDGGMYNYFYRNETLKSALKTYSQNNGLNIVFDKNAPKNILAQNVTGKFTVESGEKLLNVLAKRYGFEWFIYSGTLNITSNKFINRNIEISSDDMPMVKNSLKSLGLINKKFGYSELPAENRIIISGPETYTNMLIEQIHQLNISPSNQQFAVYRLKYASAIDQRVNFAGQQINIPGVATILQAILSNNQNINASGANRLIDQVVEPMQNQIKQVLSKRDMSVNSSENSASGTITSPLVQADNRLNTIVIRDKTTNLQIYRNLIELLDVPAPLIQVDVLIIHLDQDKLNKEGINWWASFNKFSTGFSNGNSLSLNFNKVNPGQTTINDLASFQIGLEFLAKNSLAQIVDHPSVATIDNIPAIVNVKETLYLSIPNKNSDNNKDSNQPADINTSLAITPHVIFSENNQRNIKLSIILKDGIVGDQTTNSMPTATQSDITSQTIIKEGQSMLLAGYSRNSQENVTNKVPLLGDIPGLGWLFKSSSTKNRKVSTLYLVTPKIVWLENTYKLKDYVIVGNKKFDIKNSYQIIQPDNDSFKLQKTSPININEDDITPKIKIINIDKNQIINKKTINMENKTNYKSVKPNQNIYPVAKPIIVQ